MRNLLTIIAALFTGSICLCAQEIIIPEGYELKDSIVYRPTDVMDSTLVGRSIFSLMPSGKAQGEGTAEIHQSAAVESAMTRHIEANRAKHLSGYRVRIFFDNKQNSREASEEALTRFERSHPGIKAYRSFVTPFFKVTAGDFRTKSEAMLLLQSIVNDFPTAFVVKENINFPIVDKQNSFVADTLYILKPCSNKD